VHGLAGLANAQQNCWPMILIGGASETYRGGMGAFQEERQVLIASPFCEFAHAIRYRRASPGMSRWRRGTRSTAVLAPPTSIFPTT
jgi:2-hydroxyacyl-CoA lyase 1